MTYRSAGNDCSKLNINFFIFLLYGMVIQQHKLLYQKIVFQWFFYLFFEREKKSHYLQKPRVLQEMFISIPLLNTLKFINNIKCYTIIHVKKYKLNKNNQNLFNKLKQEYNKKINKIVNFVLQFYSID